MIKYLVVDRLEVLKQVVGSEVLVNEDSVWVRLSSYLDRMAARGYVLNSLTERSDGHFRLIFSFTL